MKKSAIDRVYDLLDEENRRFAKLQESAEDSSSARHQGEHDREWFEVRRKLEELREDDSVCKSVRCARY